MLNRGWMAHNFDWPLIKKDFEFGRSAREISKNLGGHPSHVAILKRADKEGWLQTREKLPAVTRTETAVKMSNPQTQSEKYLATLGNRSVENMALILAALEQGHSRNVVARLVGFDPATLSRWLDEDETFLQQVLAMEARALTEAELSITKAHNRGDWKAASYKLERHPMTKEQYTPENRASTAINVTLNFSRDTPLINGESVEIKDS